MQGELGLDYGVDVCESGTSAVPVPEPVQVVPTWERQKQGRKPAPGAVPCNVVGGCEYDNTAVMAGGALRYGGLCKRHGCEKACGYRPCGSGRVCGNLAMHGIREFMVSGDPAVLLCDACRQHKRDAERLAELDGKLCECGRKVSPSCPEGLLCKQCRLSVSSDGAVCSFGGCGEPVKSSGLCGGHYSQWRRGDPLTQLWSTHTRRDYDGCALYMFRGVLPSGATVDVFGITEPDVKIRLRSYETMMRDRPGLEITEVHGWWRWDDKATARKVEKELKSMAVHNRSLRGGLRTESWPADDAKVRDAMATVMRYSPDYTNEGDSYE